MGAKKESRISYKSLYEDKLEKVKQLEKEIEGLRLANTRLTKKYLSLQAAAYKDMYDIMGRLNRTSTNGKPVSCALCAHALEDCGTVCVPQWRGHTDD